MTVQQPKKPPSYRQLQIARLIAYGWGYKEIGARLKISRRTVRHHAEALANLIPVEDEGEFPELFTPYMRVQCWAVWEFRIRPKMASAAA